MQMRGRRGGRLAAATAAATLLLGAGTCRGDGFFDWLKKDRAAMQKEYERLQQAPPEKGAGARTAPEPGAARAPAPLQLALPLPVGAPGGHIVFTRLVPRSVAVAGLSGTFPVPKLFVMSGDGAGARPFLVTEGFESFREPRWTPGFKTLLFVSDYASEMSACMEDIFVVDAAGADVRRVTGGQPATVAAYGSVTGAILDQPQEGAGPLALTQVNITAQGSGWTAAHPQSCVSDVKGHHYPFTLPRVAAGEIVWLKVWKDKYTAAIHFVRVEAGKVNDVGTLALRGNSLFASKPSATPDGRYVVGMGSLASWQPAPKPGTPAVNDDGTLNPLPIVSGTDSVCAYDALNGGLLLNSFEAPLGGAVKDPMLSPDGTAFAVCCGPAVREDLAVVRLDDLLAKRFQPRVLAAGSNLFPSEATMFQAVLVGHATPAWSPDGARIAATRYLFGTTFVTGQVWLIDSDGGNARQLTSVGNHQLAMQPCFSPDGRRVAFAVATARTGLITPEAFAARNCTLDVYVIDADGANLRRLTEDGVSGEPAWAP